MTYREGETSTAAELENKPEPWQFSLRTLLVVTTVLSILLAIGVHFGGAVVATAIICAAQGGMLVGSDWLIRPAHRRALAFVTSASWGLVGSAFVIGGVAFVDRMLDEKTASVLSWSFAASLFGAGVLSYYVAALRWRQLNARRAQSVKKA